MLVNVKDILAGYPPITLAEMGKVKLMNRVDTKYVMSADTLLELLRLAAPHYYVQVIDGDPVSRYRTSYLDTPEREMYRMHHAGKATREKIRVRTYVASSLAFLEVKNKSNRGRTSKKRVEVTAPEAYAGEGAFLERTAWWGPADLEFSLHNSFRRVTLVNRRLTERLTIDFDLAFSNPATGLTRSLQRTVIVELKRDGRAPSAVLPLLLALRVHPSGFSKYCMGMALTDPSLRQGRFKERLRRLARIEDAYPSPQHPLTPVTP